jgi:hypothetical protein
MKVHDGDAGGYWERFRRFQRHFDAVDVPKGQMR